MRIAAPCLSASPCGQNRRCLRKVFSARILLLMWGGQEVFGVRLLSKSSMNFLAAGPTNCSAGGGMFERISGSRSSLSRKLVWQGHIMRIAAPCLSASPSGQNRRCLRKVFSARILLLMWGGQEVFGVRLLSKSMPGRKVLSHLHVVTWRRTRSTQKLIFIGLASGRIITPE